MTDELQLKVGKVYKRCYEETQYLYLNKNPQIILNIKKGFCFSGEGIADWSVHPDQTHDITIDIKPNKREPQVGEVWEAQVDDSIIPCLIAGIIGDQYLIVAADPTQWPFGSSWVTKKYLLKFFFDQSHDIILARQS